MPDKLPIGVSKPGKNAVDENIPYHFLREQEPGPDGSLQQVNTIFLTGKECVFKCLMCDLWKNTLDYATPPGAIPRQLDYALSRLSPAAVIKLYNSSNFFDSKAVPAVDHPAIIQRLQSYQRVVVENHPRLCSEACVQFARQLNGRLEVAMGLETIHPDVWPRLNKQMTPDDFRRAALFLRERSIDVRAFVLLNPPYLTGKKENITWAVKAVQFAFESGANRCVIIPVRMGNGMMEWLYQQGHYQPPALDALEEVMETCLSFHRGQVFCDTWDIGLLGTCPACFAERKLRLEKMNLTQQIGPPVTCTCH